MNQFFINGFSCASANWLLTALCAGLAVASLILLRFYRRTRQLLNRERLAHTQLEAELLQSRDAAQAASRAKSNFLANMSHEIRTPLAAVLGFSELLLDPQISSQERDKYAQTIRRNGDLLCQLISDILDLSKVEAEKLDLTTTSLNLGELLQELRDLLSLEAAQKGLKFTIKTEGSLAPTISTDPLRLRQILINVIGNAIKFTARGHVEVQVQQFSTSPQTAQLTFIVDDSGPGIKASDWTKIFDPFTQADDSSTRHASGAGLGLALAKKLARALGGDVELAQSTPGVGSTFVVSIAAQLA